MLELDLMFVINSVELTLFMCFTMKTKIYQNIFYLYNTI